VNASGPGSGLGIALSTTILLGGLTIVLVVRYYFFSLLDYKNAYLFFELAVIFFFVLMNLLLYVYLLNKDPTIPDDAFHYEFR